MASSHMPSTSTMPTGAPTAGIPSFSHYDDPKNKTLLATKQMATEYPLTPQQQQACLHEVQDYGQGRLPFLTTTPEAPITARRPVARQLEEKGLLSPGIARATQAASVEKPWGSAKDSPNYTKMGTDMRTVMQQHVDFFDRDNDGIITMLDTFLG